MRGKFFTSTYGYLAHAWIVATIILGTYFTHKALQHEYHRRCNSDIVQVIFFRNSYFCQMIYNAVHIMETYSLDTIQRVFGAILAHP